MDEPDVPNRQRQVQIRTRRRRYLELHPEYYAEPSLELAEPQIYNQCIRRFKTLAERSAEGQDRGFAATLEAAFARSVGTSALETENENGASDMQTRPNISNNDGLEELEPPRTKEEGLQMWHEYVRRRFVEGRDVDIDYDTIDDNDAYDDKEQEARQRLDEYIDQQEEEFDGDGPPQSQTGVQDF